MSTVVDLPTPNQPPDAGLDPITTSEVDPRDDQIAALQIEIEKLKNDHDEDKFLWFLGAIAAFDVAGLLHATNWTAPIIIGLIELVAIAVMADRCRVDLVAPLIDKLTGALGRNQIR
jgi:hypothetical protein